jgi:SAM-dependent methyltransferase
MYDTIRPHLKGEILEIGSGIGNISDFLVNDGYPITLSDYNQQYCDFLSVKYAGRENVKNILSIDLQTADFNSRYYHLKEKFDTIYLLNVIEHLQDDQKAIEYCKFLLKPKGHLVLLAPAYQFLYCRLDRELGHFRRYTLRELKHLLLGEHFSVVHKQYFNLLGVMGWLVSGKISGNKVLNASETSLFNRLVPLAKLADRLVLRKTGLSAIIAGQKN